MNTSWNSHLITLVDPSSAAGRLAPAACPTVYDAQYVIDSIKENELLVSSFQLNLLSSAILFIILDFGRVLSFFIWQPLARYVVQQQAPNVSNTRNGQQAATPSPKR